MPLPRFVRFSAFDLDVRAGELRKFGVRVRLQEQALQLLLMLLEQPGEVVLRAEIRERLWPDGAVADFDQGINAAVRRLRNALGDSAEAPRYIETLAKRGYRFLAAVEHVAETVSADSGVAAVPAPVVEPEELAREAPASRARPRTHRWLPVGVGAIVLLCVGAGIALWQNQGRELPAARLVPLTTFPGMVTFPAFSPDGEKVAFSWDGNAGGRNLSIYSKPVGNGDPVRITSGAWDDRLPQWSPDGKTIAFQRGSAKGHELFLVAASGGEARKVCDMGIGLTWSPDGKEIAYAAPYAPGGSGGIVARSVESGRERQITAPQPLNDGLPVWSPDGKWIAFARTFTQTAREIFVVSSQGGKERRLTFDNQPTDGIAWTPDSRELVFVSLREGEPTLWRIRAQGGGPERFASMAHQTYWPAISLHGHRLAFDESFSDSNVWQYERGKAGAGVEFVAPRCLICSTVEDDSPRYSPDGARIVFTSMRSGAYEIWVAAADGSHPAQVTSLGVASTGSPRWSPDGKWIAFDSAVNGSPDIYVVSAQGGTPRRLTAEPSADKEPSWSHDGRWIYFTSNRGGQSKVWKAPFEGGAARQVTQGDGAEALESPDGKRLYYFRDGHVDGLWTVPVDGGAEEVVPELASVRPSRAWTVSSGGIYFYREGADGKPEVDLFDFATRRVNVALRPERRPPAANPGLDVAQDGRRLLYTQVDRKFEGLMMIENFR